MPTRCLATLALIVSIGVLWAGAAAAQRTDEDFIREATSDGLVEVELGRLASQRAASPAVRQFGDRMVRDHTAANQELLAIASARGMAPAARLEPEHQALRDRLATLSGAPFDQQYMSEMVRDHTKAVADFERQSRTATDPALRAFAAKTLPVLQEHLRLAQQIHGQVAATRPGTAAAALPAAAVPAVVPCAGAWTPAMGTNFGTCPKK